MVFLNEGMFHCLEVVLFLLVHPVLSHPLLEVFLLAVLAQAALVVVLVYHLLQGVLLTMVGRWCVVRVVFVSHV